METGRIWDPITHKSEVPSGCFGIIGPQFSRKPPVPQIFIIGCPGYPDPFADLGYRQFSLLEVFLAENGLFPVFFAQSFRGPQDSTTEPGGLETSLCALDNDIPFQLRRGVNMLTKNLELEDSLVVSMKGS